MSDFDFGVSEDSTDEYILYAHRLKRKRRRDLFLEHIQVFTALITYLQFLGVFIGLGLGLGNWGDYFKWIQAFVFHTDDFEEDENEALYFTYLSILVFGSMLGLRLSTTTNQYHTKSVSRFSLIVSYFLIPLIVVGLLLSALIVALGGKESVAVLIAFNVFLGLEIYTLGVFKFGIIRRMDAVNVFRFFFHVFMFPLLLVWAESFTDANTGDDNFSIFLSGMFLILIAGFFDMFISIHQSSFGSKILRDKSYVQWFTCCFFTDLGKDVLKEKLHTPYNDFYFFFSIIDSFEKILLAIVFGITLNVGNNENESLLAAKQAISLFSFFSSFTLLKVVVRPYKQKMDMILDLGPRISNMVFLWLGWYMIEGSDHNVIVEDREDNIAQIFFLINSGLMLLFWVVVVNPINLFLIIVRYIRIVWRPRRLIKIKRKWERVTSLEDAKRILSSDAEMRKFSEVDWFVLSPSSKLFVLCVKREDYLFLSSYKQREFLLSSAAFTRSLGVNGMHALINVTTFSMSSCGITVEHLNAIAETDSLELMPSLDTLNLSNNRFGTEGLISLMRSLMMENNSEKSFTLTTLLLDNCDLDIDAGECLGSYLEENRDLIFLSLRKNSLGDLGAIPVLDSLGENSSVEVLRLDDNILTDRVLTDTRYSLLETKSLRELWLTNNCLKGTGLEDLFEDAEELAIIVLGIGKQRPQDFLYRVLDDNGIQKVTHLNRKIIGLEPTLLGRSSPVAQNAFLHAFLENRKLRSDTPEDSYLKRCYDQKYVFARDAKSNTITGFTGLVYLYAEKGVCCFLPIALLAIDNDEQKSDLRKIIDTPDENGYTLLELCILYGASMVVFSAKTLVKFGANIMANCATEKGRRIIDLAVEHEDKAVATWASKLDKNRGEEESDESDTDSRSL